MKKILITYEASIETGDKLEYGEAATTLDFITDNMALELVDTIGKTIPFLETHWTSCKVSGY